MTNNHLGKSQINAPSHSIIFAKIVLALGGLAIGTGEFSAMGLLPNMAKSYNVSISTAGYGVITYAIGVVIGGPILAIFFARYPWKHILLGLLSVVILGNVATSVAPELYSWLIARFVAGVPHGAYYGTASLIAASIVPKSERATAIGQVMIGLALANLLGVPLSTWLGQYSGWQLTFLIISLLSFITLLLVIKFIPFTKGDSTAKPLKELSILKLPEVWATLLIATVGFAGMFSLYSYITPTLIHLVGVKEINVPWMLMSWGAGMVIGNIIGGKMSDKFPVASLYIILAWNALFLVLFTFSNNAPWLAAFLLFMIGCGFALVPALQSRLMDLTTQAQTLGATINHSAFNLSNALGAFLGGFFIDAGLGWSSPAWVGAFLAFTGIPILALSIFLNNRNKNIPLGECHG